MLKIILHFMLKKKYRKTKNSINHTLNDYCLLYSKLYSIQYTLSEKLLNTVY